MAYSDFSLYELTRKFSLTISEQADLFVSVAEATLSPFLTELLRENIPLALAINTEKARSEMLIAPILIEWRKQVRHQISLFSGVDFTVDVERGLNGVCDFIVSRSPEQLFIAAPVMMIVEAKNENLKAGLAQCIAAMLAAQQFNEQEQTHIQGVYGAVTTGTLWRFAYLEGKGLQVDQPEYYIDKVNKIMGILLWVGDSRNPAVVQGHEIS